MQFRGETNNQDICSLANRLAGLPLNDTTRYSIAEKVQDANWAMRHIFNWIMSVYGGWIPDDKNKTDLPEYSRELTLNKSFFALPAAEKILYGIDAIDSGGNYYRLKKITLEEIKERGYAESEFMDTSGVPEYYRPLANGFKVYPASDTTRSAGLKAQIGRKHTAFTISTTTTEPGFDDDFHEAVPVFMAMTYCDMNLKEKRAIQLRKKWDGNEGSTGIEGGYKKIIKEHYKSKFRENNPPTVKRNRSYVDGMV